MQEMAFSVTLPILKNTIRDIVQRFSQQQPFNVHFIQHSLNILSKAEWTLIEHG